ncbi:MAG: helix-turn-helix transcriptional regulator [Bacteroidia bacterium]|nr:helix-turn-helix transcriptional regulator [Bacteroidia bacterium]
MKKKSDKYFELLENIAAIRKDKGLSQDNIADAIGMKQAGYSLIEKGERGLDYELLLQIAIALGASVTYIIDYKKQQKSDPVEAILQIKLNSNTKDQVLKLVFGQNNIEILNTIVR